MTSITGVWEGHGVWARIALQTSVQSVEFHR